jgi:hypothetical protein
LRKTKNRENKIMKDKKREREREKERREKENCRKARRK